MVLLGPTVGNSLASSSWCNRGRRTSSSHASFFWLKTGQSCDDVIGLIPVDGEFRTGTNENGRKVVGFLVETPGSRLSVQVNVMVVSMCTNDTKLDTILAFHSSSNG
jgi:hypothetical protein